MGVAVGVPQPQLGAGVRLLPPVRSVPVVPVRDALEVTGDYLGSGEVCGGAAA